MATFFPFNFVVLDNNRVEGSLEVATDLNILESLDGLRYSNFRVATYIALQECF